MRIAVTTTGDADCRTRGPRSTACSSSSSSSPPSSLRPTRRSWPSACATLGRILRGPGRTAGTGTGRGGARGLLQLRRRRGGAPHPVGVGEDHPAGGDRRAGAGQRRRAAAEDRGARRLSRSGAGRRPRHPSSGQRADRGPALYAGLRALDVPEEPVARLWHAATLLREHRGDGHNAALVAHGIGGTEATSCSLSPSA